MKSVAKRAPKRSTRKRRRAPRRYVCELPLFCHNMDRALHAEPNAQSRGLCVVETTNSVTYRRRVLGVAYKRTPRDCGIFIHVCPWCSADLLTELAKIELAKALATSPNA